MNKTNNVLMNFLEDRKELFDKDMNVTQLINASELRGTGYLGYMFKLIYACVNHMKLIVVIFHMELTLKQRIIPHYAEMQNFSCNCAFSVLYFSHQ